LVYYQATLEIALNFLQKILQLSSHELGIVFLNEMATAGSKKDTSSSISITEVQQAFVVLVPSAAKYQSLIQYIRILRLTAANISC
jgi:hypothetical protein